MANVRHDAEPDRSVRRMRGYDGFERSVAAVASIPTDMFEKMGMPVSWPLAVYWCG